MGIKIKNIKIVPNDKGIQSILKSNDMREELTKYGNKLAKELDEIAPSKNGWKVEIGERASRFVLNVTNDDLDVKWREVANGNVAKFMASKKFRR